MVGILAQAIDAAVGPERELVLREEVGAAGEGGQQAADLVEGGVGYALFSIWRASSTRRRTAAARS